MIYEQRTVQTAFVFHLDSVKINLYNRNHKKKDG